MGNRGYALLETLFASVILATGIVGVASMFSAGTRAGIRNEQRTTATLLLYDKMEQLRSAGPLPAGGGLDSLHPISGFSETLPMANAQAAFLRLWQVQGATPQTITVVVYESRSGKPPLELARATGSW